MEIDQLLSDEAILAELGERVARRRLNLSLTQAEVATEAGVSKRTVERIESGASAQMLSFIRVLRALDLLAGLERLIPAGGPSPMALLRSRGKVRRRAPRRRNSGKPEESWTWGSEG